MNSTDSAFITRIGSAVSQFLYHARQTAGLSADDLDGTYTITFDHGDLLGIEKAASVSHSYMIGGDDQIAARFVEGETKAATVTMPTSAVKPKATRGSNPASAD